MTSAVSVPVADDPLTHAQAIADTGLRVLPIKPGRKHPPMNSWQHAATTKPETLKAWWNGLYRGYGVGIALGDQPDGRHVFAIDIDRHGIDDGFDTLHELEQQHGPLPETVQSITGSDGAHLLYTAPEGVLVRNQQTNGNRIGPGVDVRGAGGQIVCAPTIHPDTGRRYCWEDGHAPWEHPIAVAPQWLIDLVAEYSGHTCPICGSNRTR
jgi:hypothetical protein